MQRIAQFFKVSEEEFLKVGKAEDYADIILPKRATSGSAGYDFFSPKEYCLQSGQTVKIPTGIRVKIEDGWVLKIYPRSGHGFKYGVHLANSTGIIDEDYYGAKNEGHIQVKLVNDSLLKKGIELLQGDAFCQGVFVPYGTTVDDEANAKRTGGFGSTSN